LVDIVSTLEGFLPALYDVSNVVVGFGVVDVAQGGMIACSANATGFTIAPACLPTGNNTNQPIKIRHGRSKTVHLLAYTLILYLSCARFR